MEMKAGIISVIAVIGLVIVSSLLVLTVQGDKPKDTLSVSGTAELSVMPDKAEIYLNIVTEADQANKAQADNKVLSAKVIEALKNAGVKAEEIETSNYYLNKKESWNPKDMTYEEKGYVLTHTLKITTTKIDSVGQLVDTAIVAGANGVERVSFGLQKETERQVKADALKKATAAAREKAASIAENSGVTLGKITSIQESNFYYMPYEANVRNVVGDVAEDSSAGAMISPQKVDVTSSISMTYTIS